MMSQSSTSTHRPTLQQRLYQSVRHLAKEPSEQQRQPDDESADAERFRTEHGDARNWSSRDFEDYWDLARAMPAADRSPESTR